MWTHKVFLLPRLLHPQRMSNKYELFPTKNNNHFKKANKLFAFLLHFYCYYFISFSEIFKKFIYLKMVEWWKYNEDQSTDRPSLFKMGWTFTDSCVFFFFLGFEDLWLVLVIFRRLREIISFSIFVPYIIFDECLTIQFAKMRTILNCNCWSIYTYNIKRAANLVQ